MGKKYYVIVRNEYCGHARKKDENDNLTKEDLEDITTLDTRTCICENAKDVLEVLLNRFDEDEKQRYVHMDFSRLSFGSNILNMHAVKQIGGDYYFREYTVHEKFVCENKTDKQFAF